MLYYHLPALRRLTQISAIWCATSLAAAADAPRVTTDIPPIQSLVAQVMGDLGTPSVVVPATASPHGHAMRPSQAAALNAADIVFWVGPELTPWLERSLNVLSDQASVVSLLHSHGTHSLGFRDEDELESGEGHSDHEGHDHHHDGLDPHAWLDPENGTIWLQIIANQLAKADPENAAQYKANAKAAISKLADVTAEIKADLSAVKSSNFIVFHDAFQYFETAFGISTVGAIALGDASQPSPAHIAEIKAILTEKEVVCAFTEPQLSADLVGVVLEGTNIRTATLDPLGASLELGPDLYASLLKQISAEMVSCLAR